MFGVILTIHIFVCAGLIIAVLMQSSKGEGLAGAFGGGGISGAVFGGRGAASFLSRATTTLAVVFMITCILLTFTGGAAVGTPSSRVSKEAQKAVQDAQVTPMNLPGEGDQGATQTPQTTTPPTNPPPSGGQ